MAEVTADFAIKYLLDDCDDCPENKDGECMTQSHCFEVKYLAIKALEQKPKTGHWIADIDKWGDVVTTVNGYRCDKCNVFNTDKDNYCPNCGVKMVEPQERSGEE